MYRSLILCCPLLDRVMLAQDISAAEQASLNQLTVPELSPSDPSSNATSPSSSEPVTPVDPPSLAAPPNPLVAGKHQPDPQPYRPFSKTTSKGTEWVRQSLLSLGKRKRRLSDDSGLSTTVDMVQVQQAFDSDEEEISESPAETTPPDPATQVSHPFASTTYSLENDHFASQSLFTLPNVPIHGMPTQVRPRIPRVRNFAARFSLLMLIDWTSLYSRCSSFGAAHKTRYPRHPRPQSSQPSPPRPHANRRPVLRGHRLRSPLRYASCSSSHGASPSALQSCYSHAR